jgi:hypothetical protein
MKKQILPLIGAGFVSRVFAATVAAADPTPTPVQARSTIPAVLGMTQAEVQALRHDGQSLAQIAAQKKVDPQKLVDALASRWTTRIDARVANGALTASETAALKAQVETQAKSMVNKTTLGGMQGAAVGAGPRGRTGAAAGAGAGMGRGRQGAGSGTGTCDGTGRP